MNESTRVGLRIPMVLGLAASCIVAGWWFASTGGRPPHPADDLSIRRQQSPELEKMLEGARDLQRQKHWEEAKHTYEVLQANLSPGNKIVSDDIDRNLRLLEALLEAPKAVQSDREVNLPKDEHPPEKFTEEELRGSYSVGKCVRSCCIFSATGHGTNKAWGLAGEASFAYVAEVITTTLVVENDAIDGRLVFEQSFDQVSQTLAVSNESLALNISEETMVGLNFAADQALARIPPQYQWIRPGAQGALMLHQLDPNLKHLLTFLQANLKKAGLSLSDDRKNVAWAAQVDRLSGTKLRLTYLSGVGVTSVRQIEGYAFNNADLIQIAKGSTLLFDHFIFPSTEKKEGESWETRLNDVSRLAAPIEPDTKVEGTISLRRNADWEANKVASLSVTGGKVTTHSENDNSAKNHRIKIKNGEMRFSLTEKIVTSAHLTFEADSLIRSKNHLLFGTERFRNLTVESQYRAQLVP